MTKYFFLSLLLISLLSNCNDEKKDFNPPLLIDNDKIEKKLSELKIIKDYEVGIEKSKLKKKPIILIFTAYGSVISRELENEVILGNDSIFNILKNNYINVWLYVDDKSTDNKWSDLQVNKFKSGYQSEIFVLDTNGNKLSNGMGYSKSKKGLLPLLLDNKDIYLNYNATNQKK